LPRGPEKKTNLLSTICTVMVRVIVPKVHAIGGRVPTASRSTFSRAGAEIKTTMARAVSGMAAASPATIHENEESVIPAIW